MYGMVNGVDLLGDVVGFNCNLGVNEGGWRAEVLKLNGSETLDDIRRSESGGCASLIWVQVRRLTSTSGRNSIKPVLILTLISSRS